jgi:hypothetical protein
MSVPIGYPTAAEFDASPVLTGAETLPVQRADYSTVVATLAAVGAVQTRVTTTIIGDATYTVQASDIGTRLAFISEADVLVTLPADIAAGFVCELFQEGVGQVSVVAASGAEVVNSYGDTKTRAQYSVVSVAVYRNSGGGAARWVLRGDTGA